MSEKPRSENYYIVLLQDILLNVLEQNKIVKSYLLQKNYDNALVELDTANKKIDEFYKFISLLETIKKEFSENSEEDIVYN